MTKYVRRVWISPDTHSSGYVMCYYNRECLNSDLNMFLRIADCNNSFLLQMNMFSSKDLYRFFNRLNKLLSLEIRRFVFKEYIFIYRDWPGGSFLEVKKTYRTWNMINKKNKNLKNLKLLKSLIRLHGDKLTCSPKQWYKKLEVIRKETQTFYNFLTINNII